MRSSISIKKTSINSALFLSILLISNAEVYAKQERSTGSNKLCKKLLSDISEIESAQFKLTPTKRFIAYLQDLSHHSMIDVSDLGRLATAIKNGLGPDFSLIKTSLLGTRVGAREHQEQITAYLQDPAIDLNEIKRWVLEYLEANTSLQLDRNETSHHTKRFVSELTVVSVPAGTFEFKNKAPQEIRAFEVMSTLVTQQLWVEVMGDNPAYFSKGPDSINQEFEGKSIRLQPHHPVDSITWWSALVFANELSKTQNLAPVYDLSDLKPIPGTSAADGTLKIESGELKLIHYSDPSVSLGFRLPTVLEQEYLRTNLGKLKYHYNLKQVIGDYAWYAYNSKGRTHPVAQKFPHLIEDKPVYDLFGLLNEWSQDSPSPAYLGEVNAEIAKNQKTVKGGSWETPPEVIQDSSDDYYYMNQGFMTIGLRLVRSLP